MNTTIRRFTESDWQGLAGAEEFEDGGQPFIGDIKLDGEEATLLGDAKTFAVHLYYTESPGHEDENGSSWHEEFWSLDHSLKSQVLIENFLLGVYGMVTTRKELEELGFERSL